MFLSAGQFSEKSMSYILEKVVTPDQRAELARFDLASPFTSGPADVYEWLVDRDRGLYFINLGGGVDRDYFLVFADRTGSLLRAQGERRAKDASPGRVDEFWRLESISIPRALAARKEEILSLFREALAAYGSLGDAKRAQSVSVNLGTPKLV